jgi:hypothetical protein
MSIRNLPFRILACAAVLLGATLPALAAAARPQAFTAVYEVQRGGSTIGESVLTLRADGNGTWTYASKMRGTAGLAALLGADLEETSRFRWRDGRPEALSYDYELDAAVKHKTRHVVIDWKAGKVSVDDGKKGRFSYAPQPGLVERHLLPLALGWALDEGRKDITLPVAVRDRVQQQRFRATGKDAIEVPAGRFQALRVDRTDDDKGFSAWYAPGKYAVPVKLAQSDGGDITLLLKSYSEE